MRRFDDRDCNLEHQAGITAARENNRAVIFADKSRYFDISLHARRELLFWRGVGDHVRHQVDRRGRLITIDSIDRLTDESGAEVFGAEDDRRARADVETAQTKIGGLPN